MQPEGGRAVPCKSAEAAQRMAERMAPTKLGVVAFWTCGNARNRRLRRRAGHLFQSGAFAGAVRVAVRHRSRRPTRGTGGRTLRPGASDGLCPRLSRTVFPFCSCMWGPTPANRQVDGRSISARLDIRNNCNKFCPCDARTELPPCPGARSTGGCIGVSELTICGISQVPYGRAC